MQGNKTASPSKSGGSAQQKAAGKKGKTALGPTESSLQHREFLLQTLQDVKDQLANPPPLLDPPPAGQEQYSMPMGGSMVGSAAVDGYGEESKEEGEQQEYKEEESDTLFTVDRTMNGMPYSVSLRPAEAHVLVFAFQPQHIQKWVAKLSLDQLAVMNCSKSDPRWQLSVIEKVGHQDTGPTLNGELMQTMTRKLQYQRGRKVDDQHMLVSLTCFEELGHTGVVDVVVYNVKSGERVCTTLPGGDNCSDENAFQAWCETMLERLNATTGPLSISFN